MDNDTEVPRDDLDGYANLGNEDARGALTIIGLGEYLDAVDPIPGFEDPRTVALLNDEPWDNSISTK